MSFDRIKNSTFINFYINEIWAVVTTIRTLEERLNESSTFKDMRKKKGNNILSPSVEPHEISSSILSSTSRLHKLFESSSQRNEESDNDYQFRKARSKYLRKLLLPKKKTGHEIFKSSVRNAIEHFDERIDLLNHRVISGESEVNSKPILYNLTISSEDMFVDWNSWIPLKVLAFETGNYFMVDHMFNIKSINLYEIFKEVNHINEACIAWGKKQALPKGEHFEKPVGILKTPKHYA